MTLCPTPIGSDLHMKDNNVQVTRRPTPPLSGHNVTQGITLPNSDVILPMIGTVTHAIQYGTAVTVQKEKKDLILLALSLLWTQWCYVQRQFKQTRLLLSVQTPSAYTSSRSRCQRAKIKDVIKRNSFITQC